MVPLLEGAVWESFVSVPGAPLADASADASLCDEPKDANAIDPSAVMLRSVREVTAWLARVRARAMPTDAVLAPSASAFAEVIDEVRWEAVALNEPVTSMRLSPAVCTMSTLVVTLLTVTA